MHAYNTAGSGDWAPNSTFAPVLNWSVEGYYLKQHRYGPQKWRTRNVQPRTVKKMGHLQELSAPRWTFSEFWSTIAIIHCWLNGKMILLGLIRNTRYFGRLFPAEFPHGSIVFARLNFVIPEVQALSVFFPRYRRTGVIAEQLIGWCFCCLCARPICATSLPLSSWECAFYRRPVTPPESELIYGYIVHESREIEPL